MENKNLQELIDQFMLALMQCIADHDYQKLFESATLFIRQVGEITGETMTGTDFFESLGHGCLVQQNYEKAYALFRTGAQYCSSRVAQFNLGNMFLSGDGLQTNLGAAYYWF